MNIEALSPLKFVPRLVPKMWGGRNLETLGKDLPEGEPIGESWELYDFPPVATGGSADWVSVQVRGGPLDGKTLHELMVDDAMRQRILGTTKPVATPAGPQFPLLVKFLDAEQDLSVQVHPTQAYAEAHDGAHLKNEAWHVIQHADGARLLKGLKDGVSREQFEAAIHDGSVEDHIVALPAKVGETHYLPSGTVHALGAGMLVAEVQTPSDTTYRVYDFQRVDPSTGKQRQLHVEQALQVIGFGEDAATPPAVAHPGDGIVVDAPQFETVHRSAEQGRTKPLPGTRCSVLVILEGNGSILVDGASDVTFQAGETILLPSELEGPLLSAESDCRWLETTFPV